MKKAVTIFSALAFVLLSACGKKDNPLPEEANNSSYEFKFLTGPLAGQEYKAGGLSAEQAVALFVKNPESGDNGISLQLLHGDFTFAMALALDGTDRPRPFALDGADVGTQAAFSLKADGAQYVFGSVSGNLSIKNLKHTAVGGGSGLATFELSFENAVFYDATAEGDNIDVPVAVSGKIVVR